SPWIQAIHTGGQLEFGLVPFVGPKDAVARIGEPDRAIRVNGGIVGRVELLSIEVVDQDGPGAVVLPAAHPARVVLTRDQPAFVAAAAVRNARLVNSIWSSSYGQPGSRELLLSRPLPSSSSPSPAPDDSVDAVPFSDRMGGYNIRRDVSRWR